MPFPCNNSAIWPDTSICSGHGYCAAAGCVCDTGWSGVSDFVNRDTLDCNVSQLAMTILHSVSLFFGATNVLWIPRLVWRQQQKAMAMSRSGEERGTKQSCFFRFCKYADKKSGVLAGCFSSSGF